MKNYASPRVRCFLRREYPLLGFLGMLTLGQVVGYLVAGDGRFLPLVFIGCLFSGRAAFALGVVSMCVSLSSPIVRPTTNAPILATVVEEPRYRAPGRVELGLSLASGSFARCRAVHLPWRNIAGISMGDIFQFSGSIMPIELPINPFSYDANLRRHGYSFNCKIENATPPLIQNPNFFSRIRAYIFESINKHFGVGGREGLFLSMVLGFRDLISDRTFLAFQRTGLAHLLVVSGFHVTLIFGVFLYAFRFASPFLFQGQPNIMTMVLAGSCLAALLFVMLIGVDGASLRAAIALVALSVCRIVERGQGIAHSIMVALLVLLVIWPGCFFEPGIQLTFAALIGIVYGAHSTCRWPWQRALTTLIAPSVATFGISVLWFESASLIGFILNPLLAPAASTLFTVGGLIALFLFLTGIDSAGVVIRLIFWIIERFADLVVWASELPGAAITLEGSAKYPIGVLTIVLALLLLARRISRYLIEMGIVGD